MLDQGLSTPRSNKGNKPNQGKKRGSSNNASKVGNSSGRPNRHKKRKIKKYVPSEADERTRSDRSQKRQKQSTGINMAVDQVQQQSVQPVQQLQLTQKKPSTNKASNGKNGNNQPKQKKAAAQRRNEKKKAKKPPSPPKLKIICIAEKSIIKCIDLKTSSTSGGEEVDGLIDLPKEQINDLPEVPYKRTKKPIVVISTAATSDKAVSEIRTELSINQRRLNGDANGHNSFQYLGFDVEIKPKFQKGGDENPPALLQLATATSAYLFRLSYQGMNGSTDAMTESLESLLSDKTIIKVGVGIHKDVEDLKRVYGPHCCSDATSYLDIGPLAKLRWPKIQRCGLRNLTATLLGYRLSKAQQMKNWEMKQMTPAMISYAAADALVALDLLAAIVG